MPVKLFVYMYDIIKTTHCRNIAMEFVSDEESMTMKHQVRGERFFANIQELSAPRPRRALDLAAAVACVACVLTLVACGLTVHMYVQIQTRNFRDELTTILREEVRAGRAMADPQGLYTDNQEGNYDSQVIELTGEERVPKRKRTASDDQTSSSPTRQKKRQRNEHKERHNKKNPKNKEDKCCRTIKKELGPMIQDALTSRLSDMINRTEKALNQIQGSNEDNKHFIGIDHYTTAVDEDFIQQKMGKFEPGNPFNRSVEIPEWSGTLYRNRSLRIQEAPMTLKMFAPSSADSQRRLFDLDTNTGLFRARYSGLYHIYAHAQFRTGRNKGIVLLHRSPSGFELLGTLTCPPHDQALYSQFIQQPCVLAGTMTLKADDTVEVQLLDSQTTLGVKNTELYMGAVLIRPETGSVNGLHLQAFST
ncbi:uncharacterized protein LOC127833970 isoform X3 [Dreissena polymorpha]|uniref:uncharacterized protein LOC127833970 isoform X3 n=1 Tax=Dreissena polymorpha TaxID=45954 RepID=UPI002263E32F|nr:uncharacterized protein LOC127833970 isoform X3 [Dreissena polymorpha]